MMLQLNCQVLEPLDNMRPISHALALSGDWWFEHQSAAEIGLFCVPVPIADDETMHAVVVAIEKSNCQPTQPGSVSGLSVRDRNSQVDQVDTSHLMIESQPSGTLGISRERIDSIGLSTLGNLFLRNECHESTTV